MKIWQVRNISLPEFKLTWWLLTTSISLLLLRISGTNKDWPICMMPGEDICIDLVDDSVAFKLNFRKNSPIRYNIYLVGIYQHINNIVFGVMLIAIGCASGSHAYRMLSCCYCFSAHTLSLLLLLLLFVSLSLSLSLSLSPPPPPPHTHTHTPPFHIHQSTYFIYCFGT